MIGWRPSCLNWEGSRRQVFLRRSGALLRYTSGGVIGQQKLTGISESRPFLDDQLVVGRPDHPWQVAGRFTGDFQPARGLRLHVRDPNANGWNGPAGHGPWATVPTSFSILVSSFCVEVTRNASEISSPRTEVQVLRGTRGCRSNQCPASSTRGGLNARSVRW